MSKKEEKENKKIEKNREKEMKRREKEEQKEFKKKVKATEKRLKENREKKSKNKKGNDNFKGYGWATRIIALILCLLMLLSVCATLITYLIAG